MSACAIQLLNTHGLVPFKLPWQTTKQIHGTPPRVIPLVDAHATLGYPQLRRASHNTAGLTAAAQGYPKRRRDTHNIKGPPTTQQGHPRLDRATLSIQQQPSTLQCLKHHTDNRDTSINFIFHVFHILYLHTHVIFTINNIVYID